MFDWLGKYRDKSGKSQGILISCVSGNPVLNHLIDKNILDLFDSRFIYLHFQHKRIQMFLAANQNGVFDDDMSYIVIFNWNFN